MPRKPDPNFSSDFASPAQWAAIYRAYGLQIIPCYSPGEVKPGTAWKRPALSEWVPLQEALVSDATFGRWYDPVTGEHRNRRNMGILTGRASDNAYIIDLDTHKNPAAMAWWISILEVHNSGLDLETPRQQTGGGGLQLLFRAPPGFIVPTNRTTIGVDIRGQGGFAVLPSSLHESGEYYEWLPGRAPWEIPILMSPPWLLEEIIRLVLAHGGTPGGGGAAKSNGGSSAADYDAFGHVIDGRETYMRDMIWAALIGYRADSPIPPGLKEFEATLADYHRNASARSPAPNEQNEHALEREGRGITLFKQKWAYALGEWHNEIAAAAKERPPNPDAWVKAATAASTATAADEPPGRHSLLQSSRRFTEGFMSPAYLIDGIMQQGYLYSLTARTNHGKTAVGMYVAQAVARGVPMHSREVKQGTVLMLAGENPDDIRARFMVLADAHGFDPNHVKICFVPGVINLIDLMPQIRAETDLIEDLVLVLVDTAAAYFPGDDLNDNSQQGAYARVLRSLTTLHGKPAVLVNCHPVKNAARDNLLPLGGSAFVNEVDGNLTLWETDKQVSLHWQGKFRGPEFEPLVFELRSHTSERVKDAKGRLMPAVVAHPITDLVVEMGEARRESDENLILRLIHDNPNASFTDLAAKAGFMVDGKLQKRRVQSVVDRLKADKMVERHRGGKYVLTRKGEKELGD